MNNIVDYIKEQTTGGMVGPVTSTGQGISVAYLPGSFTTMKNMLRSLNPVKNKWKLEVLEDKNTGDYNVKIEDGMHIKISPKDWKEFNEKVTNIVGKTELDLTQLLNEAQVEELTGALTRLQELIKGKILQSKAVTQTVILMNYWKRTFPKSKNIPLTSQTLIDLNNYNENTNILIDKIDRQDLGQIEQLSHSLEEEENLSTFEPFSKYEYLIGCNIKSEYLGVVLSLELKVGLDMVPDQLIRVDSEELEEEMSNYPTIKVVKNMIVPRMLMFSPQFFDLLQKNIRDL